MAEDGIKFRSDFGLWWPDYDHKPEKCFRFVMNGLLDMDAAIGLCRQRRVCIQAGGHAGLWPLRLARYFSQVVTFEPEPKLFACLKRNVAEFDNIDCLGLALSNSDENVKLRPSVSAGSWRVEPDGRFEVKATTIDALNLLNVDAIFLDIEGYEVEALTGAKETIQRFHPILHVEELPRAKKGIQEFMKGIHYRLFQRVGSGDAVYIP